MSEVLLVSCNANARLLDWRRLFCEVGLDVEVRDISDETVDPATVFYALCFQPPPGRLAQLSNLRLIISLGAGVDHLTCDPTCPAGVPIVRMVTDETRRQMRDYLAWATLSLLRDLPRLVRTRARRQWDHFAVARTADQCRVGILGLGVMGQSAAQTLTRIGFQVGGWSRRGREIPGLKVHTGERGLKDLAANSDVLICALPANPTLAGIIDRNLLQCLPPAAGIVNVGRAEHLVVSDLIEYLDSGSLRGAILDVTAQEPLAADDALWLHPRIFITSHLASVVSQRSAVGAASLAIRSLRGGRSLPHLFDRKRGY